MSTTTQRPRVAIIDVDGVIYDYVAHLGDIAARHFDRPRHEFPEATIKDFFLHWGMTTDEYLELVDVGFAQHGFIACGDPYVGALAGWHLLTEAGVRTHIATHCGDDGDPTGHRAARLRWLRSQGFVYDDITFTKDKASVAIPYLEAGWEVYAVDDAPPNYADLAATGAEAYLLDQRWNRDMADARRAADFADFARIVTSSVHAS